MRPPRVLALLVASVALVAVLFLFVLPGRAYLAQRRTLAASPAPAAPAASSTPAKTSNRGLPSRIWRDLQFWN